MIVKEFGKDFFSDGGALTLNPEEVCENEASSGIEYSRTHKDGWTIKGVIQEDYYAWVNEFEASHPKYGKVWGDFEVKVYADSEEGFQHFYKHHEPDAWDYMDI